MSAVAQPGELQFKVWLIARAALIGVKPKTLYNRMARGKAPWPDMRRVNKRVVFVKV